MEFAVAVALAVAFVVVVVSMAMADAMPVAMLFVRSKDGKSHSPDEYTSPEDIGMSARVLYKFLQTFTFPEDEESDYVTYYDLP